MKLIAFLCVFLAGVIIGWQGQLQMSTQPKVDVQETKAEKPILKPSDNLMSKTTFQFLTNENLLNNAKSGMLIALIKENLDIENQKKLNEEVIQYAFSLVKNSKDYESTERHLLALLGNDDTKETILNILAKFYADRNQFKKSIALLYELRSMKNFDEDYQRVTNQIAVFTRKNIKLLSEQGYNLALTDFFEFILSNEPNNYDVQLQYAKFEYRTRKFEHAEQLATMLLNHSDYASQAEMLLQKSRHQKELIEKGVVPVPIEKMGDHFLVEALINNQEPVRLIVDTGASLTVLSSKTVKDLGLNLGEVHHYAEFSTANGIVKAPVFELESMSIRNHLVRGLKVGILPGISQPKIGGLLGMNFLSQFVFFLDQKNSTLELIDIE